MPGRPIVQPSGRFALVNGRIALPGEIVTGKCVIVERGRITGIADAGALNPETEAVDVGGRLITPGLIDLHTHGAMGHTFNEPTVDAFAAIVEENARHGVTALLGTLAPAPVDDLLRCLEFGRRWVHSLLDGAQLLGMHLESPYVSLAQKGALDLANLRLPTDSSVDRLLAYQDAIKIMAFAPELPGALELTARLNRLGIVPAAGHSSATDDQVAAAMRVGLRHITHIWSAQSTTIRQGPWRKPGLLEASLVFDGLTVEMIADNRHLPPTLMKLAYKCIGPDRLCVISDATGGAGLAEGSRFTMGALEYEVKEGVGMMLDRSAFAGSATLVNQMIPVLTQLVGVPLPEALRMLTLTPAKVIGVDGRKGSLAAGKDADLAIFDADFTAWRTMVRGRWVYAA